MADVQMNGIEFEVRSNTAQAAQGINELTNSLKRLRSATAGGLGLKSVAKDAGSIMKALSGFGKGMASLVGTPFKTLANGATSLAKSMGNVLSSLKRIAFYRVIRSAIKEITKAFDEGSERAYLYAKKYGDATKYVSNALTGLSSASFKMQNQLGAAWATLLAQIAPIVSQIISLVTAAANAITQLFAILGGHSTYMKATNYTKDWADATKAGGAAAKEWRNQLMKFDELNRLDEPNKGGGGGGSNKPSDYDNMFTESAVSKSIKEFVDNIKKYIKDADWKGLGKFLGNAINDLINSINWGKLGKKVGEFINALFTTAYWTLKTINFRNIGNKVAEFLNNALSKIDTYTVGKTIARWFTILPEFLIGVVEKLNWKQLGEKVKGLITGFFDELTDWVKGIDWGEFTENALDGLAAFIEGLDVKQIVASVKKFFGAVWDATLEIVSTLDKKLEEWDIGGKISDYFDNLDIEGIKASIKQTFSDMIGGIKDSLAMIWKDIHGWFVEKLNGLIDLYNEYIGDKIGKHIDKIPIETEIQDPPTSEIKDVVKDAADKIKKESKKNNAHVDTVSDVIDYEDDMSSRPEIDSVAKMTKTKQTFTTPEIISTANFTNRKVNIPTEFDSTANFKYRKTGISTSWDATANFTKTKLDSSLPRDGNNIKLNATAYITRTTGGNVTVKEATGGVYSNGRWQNIARFAGGGLARGSQLFWARESGPELVGTLGGHTAVMNNNQIVSSVSAGVARAVSGVRFALQDGGTGNNEDALYNAMVRALNDADNSVNVDIDGERVYSGIVRRNKREIFATGANPMLARA